CDLGLMSAARWIDGLLWCRLPACRTKRRLEACTTRRGRFRLTSIRGHTRANLIKLHRLSGKVSYLVYPDFETDPHPALLRSVQRNLRTREIDCLEYAGSANPPILHRKEAFLRPDDRLRAKCERLTRQEERAGLLDDTATIGTRSGWSARLRATGYALRGHRLIRSQSGDESTKS